MKPFFSVIIPTLNEEAFLPRILSCLALQSGQNFEVIVVDGRSDDDTAAAAARFHTAYPLRFYRVKKRNVSWQRNYGAVRAKANFLIFLDADMTVGHGFTNNLSVQVKKTHGSFYLPQITSDGNNIFMIDICMLINMLVYLLLHTSKPFSAGGAMVVSAKIFKKLGGFNHKMSICEDHDIVRRASRQGIRMRVISRNYVRFSPRRVEQEGFFPVVYKFLLSSFVLLFRRRTYSKIYEYPMGGHLYRKQRSRL